MRNLAKYILFFTILTFVFSSCSKDDDSNDNDPVAGCIDPQAVNYNPDANTDDGSCQYSILGSWEIVSYTLEGQDIMLSYQYLYQYIYNDGTYNIWGQTTSNEMLDVSGTWSTGGLFNHEITFINEFGDTSVFIVSQITGSFIAMQGDTSLGWAEIEAVKL